MTAAASKIVSAAKGGAAGGGAAKGGVAKGGATKGAAAKGGAVKGGAIKGTAAKGGAAKGKAAKGGAKKGICVTILFGYPFPSSMTSFTPLTTLADPFKTFLVICMSTNWFQDGHIRCLSSRQKLRS